MTRLTKIILIAVPSFVLFLGATIYGSYMLVSHTWTQVESQVADPKFAASVASSMISMSDPPPAAFAYKGAVDMMFTKIVILEKKQHFIILVQARQNQSNHTLKQAIASNTHYGPITGKNFEGESEGEMTVGNGTLEYELGRFTASEGGDFQGMLGLLKNDKGQPRVLIESFERGSGRFDFDVTKKFLKGITSVK